MPRGGFALYRAAGQRFGYGRATAAASYGVAKKVARYAGHPTTKAVLKSTGAALLAIAASTRPASRVYPRHRHPSKFLKRSRFRFKRRRRTSRRRRRRY